MKKVMKLLLVVMAVMLAVSMVGVAGADVPNIYTSVVYTGEAVYGYNEGFDIGYGESVSMQFDVYEATVGARWSFFVTENDVTTEPNGAHNYKAKSTNVLGFATTAGGSAAAIMDWFGGTSYGKSYTAGTFFQAGYTYKFVYTTATDASSLDGMMEIWVCETAKVGTSSETWSCWMYQRNFGDTSSGTYDYHPSSNIRLGLWTNGGAIDMKIGNVKVESSEGLSADETDLTAYGAITMENVRPTPVGEATTNPQMYIGEYEGELAHIFFGTTTNVDAEYGVILTTSENVSYAFKGLTVGSTGKYGIAIYNIPDGDYTARAYVGPGDNRTYGEKTYFTAGKASYTVTYDLNGAKGDLTTETIAQGTCVAEPADGAVTLSGATLSYWADEEGNEFDFTKILTKDVTLTPVFEGNDGKEILKKYISTNSGQYIGVNENTAITYGDTVTWQFDVLAYKNTGSQFRISIGSGTVAEGQAMQYRPNTGYQNTITGFTAKGANDGYGGTLTQNKTISNLLLAGYTYKLVYVAPSATYAADASAIMYECPTAFVGTPLESWTVAWSRTGIDNTEGGNCFAPYSKINFNFYFGGAGIEFAMANSTVKVNDGTATANEIYMTTSFEEDYLGDGNEIEVTIPASNAFGLLDAGLDIGYGETVEWTFTMSDYVAGSWFGFFVSEGDVKSNWYNAIGNKTGYVSNRVVFTSNSYDWLAGTHEGNKNANNIYLEGAYYKLTYTATSSESASDGVLRFARCTGEAFGTETESWNTLGGVTGFGADNSPLTDVRIGMVVQNAATSFVLKDSVITLPDGMKINGALVGTSGVTVTK